MTWVGRGVVVVGGEVVVLGDVGMAQPSAAAPPRLVRVLGLGLGLGFGFGFGFGFEFGFGFGFGLGLGFEMSTAHYVPSRPRPRDGRSNNSIDAT